MKNETRILFDTQHDFEYYYEEVKQELIAEYGEEITDEEIFDEIYTRHDAEWDDFESEFKNYFEKTTLVCFGTVGKWYGDAGGYEIINGWFDFLERLSGLDYITIKDENGHLYVDGCHHDGHDYYEFRELTDKGWEYVNNCVYDEPSIKALKNNFYSKLPRLANKIAY